MSVRRRHAILEWARRAGAWIIEDDYDSEFRHGASPVPSLHGLDADGRVLYVGTFSKSLFPSLRLGFVVVPPPLIDTLLAASRAAAQQPPMLEQMVLTDFIAGGHYERHLRRMRAVYRERLEAVVDSAARYCGESLRLKPATAGLHVVGELTGVADRQVAGAAAARGLETMPLSAYCLSSTTPVNGLVLGFGCVRPDALSEGMARLGEAIEAAADGEGAGEGATYEPDTAVSF
jgi:GntR family transcriptional regulator/MocR family aminotransferase